MILQTKDLIEALGLWRDLRKGQQLGTNALNEIRTTHDPLRCAERYNEMQLSIFKFLTRRFMLNLDSLYWRQFFFRRAI